MQLTLLVGSILQVFGPAAVVAIPLLVSHPPLMVIATFGAFVALAPLLCTALVFTVVVAASGDDTVHLSGAGATAGYDQRVVLLMANFVFQELFRYIMARAVVAADWYFRGRTQVLHSSRFRTLPCGAALGLGFAVTRTVLTFGALIDANVAVLDSDCYATHSDFHACPPMPFIYFQPLTSLF